MNNAIASRSSPVLVFIHINKTGGNTVSHMLRSSYGLRNCQVEPWDAPWRTWMDPPFSKDDLDRLRRFYPNLRSVASHRIFGHIDLHDDGDDVRYFTFMRDPLKSCTSRFQYKIQVSKKDFVFENWIQQESSRNHQTKWIAGVEDVPEAIRTIKRKNIFVGLTERFDESMLMLKAFMAGDLDLSYRRVNFARSNVIKDKLLENERTRQMVVDAQQADLELYRYVKEELYPTYQQAYGPSLEADVARYRETRINRFNYWNLTACRVKHYGFYKPLLSLHRKGVKVA
jgi:hypothetical protein